MYLPEANIQLIKHHNSFITFGNIDQYFFCRKPIFLFQKMIFICLHWCDFVWLTFSASSYSSIESSLTALVLRVLSFSGPCIPHRQCKVCLQRVLPFIPLFKPLLFVWSTWPLLEPLLETVRHFYSLLTVLELFRPKNVGIFRRFCLILA